MEQRDDPLEDKTEKENNDASGVAINIHENAEMAKTGEISKANISSMVDSQPKLARSGTLATKKKVKMIDKRSSASREKTMEINNT